MWYSIVMEWFSVRVMIVMILLLSRIGYRYMYIIEIRHPKQHEIYLTLIIITALYHKVTASYIGTKRT